MATGGDGAAGGGAKTGDTACGAGGEDSGGGGGAGGEDTGDGEVAGDGDADIVRSEKAFGFRLQKKLKIESLAARRGSSSGDGRRRRWGVSPEKGGGVGGATEILAGEVSVELMD